MNSGDGRAPHQGPERDVVGRRADGEGCVGAVDVGERGLALAGLGEYVRVRDGEQRLDLGVHPALGTVQPVSASARQCSGRCSFMPCCDMVRITNPS
ncbi:hypothetical protein [Streptomyces sp. NPDC059063]|uniref:hypothetical protein n=1 Tax=unclassified Streptomyces TaxID=2593676 RepID=UPI00367825FF